MSKEPIIPIEGKGWEFEEKGFQERNLENLMKVLSKREVTDALTVMSETERETWKDIKATVLDLADFVSMGGLSAMEFRITNLLERNIEKITTPLTNAINGILNEALKPVQEYLINLTNDLANFINQGETGAFIGAIGGKILGYFIPGGQIWEIILALLGSAVEQIIKWLIGNIGTQKEQHEAMEKIITEAIQETGEYPLPVSVPGGKMIDPYLMYKAGLINYETYMRLLLVGSGVTLPEDVDIW